MLKTTNYKVKKYDLTLDTAYAAFRGASVGADNKTTAYFGIHQNRESAINNPLEVVSQSFVWDRKTDIAVASYDKAKGQEEYTVEYSDGSLHTHTKDGCLYGWKDDYVTEN